MGAEGKPPVDPEVLPNASKLAKSAFALAFCAAGGGVRMRFRRGDEQKKKHNERKTMYEMVTEWIYTYNDKRHGVQNKYNGLCDKYERQS